MTNTMNQTHRDALRSISADDLQQYATKYFIQAKREGFTFEQLLEEANEVHPNAVTILKTVFGHA